MDDPLAPARATAAGVPRDEVLSRWAWSGLDAPFCIPMADVVMLQVPGGRMVPPRRVKERSRLGVITPILVRPGPPATAPLSPSTRVSFPKPKVLFGS